LSGADVVVLTGIYAAGEAPMPGVTTEALAEAIRPHVGQLHVVPALADLPAAVVRIARPGDLVITLGAGSIGRVSEDIVAALAAAEAGR
jgi:UDP-N-acetylmuramate--alanine ligase